MLKNFLKIAFRQLGKHKFYSAIKIGGFALGIATCLLIALYIRNESGYDQNYTNGDRLYRLMQNYKRDDGSINSGPSQPAPMAQAIAKDFPQVELAARIMPYPLFAGAGSNEVRLQGQTQDIYEEGFTYADQSLFDMFRFPMIYGDAAHALSEPNSIVISKRKADKYFPHQDPVGKILYLNDDMKQPYKIGGVIRNPDHTHLGFDFYLSLTGHELWSGEQQTWLAGNYDSYLLLRPGVNPVEFQGKLLALYKKYSMQEMSGFMKNPEDIYKRMSFLLEPVKDIHLNYADDDSIHHGDKRFVWLFGVVGAFILLLACINFINLSTARSANRAKEVGLRKVVGSQRCGLIVQFLTESLLLSYLSFLLALGMAWLLLPFFNRMTNVELQLPWTEWWLLPILFTAGTVVGLLAGIYPAAYLSRFRPVEVLKGQLARGGGHSRLRSVLVVFQFTTSVILIIATFVVYRQVNFIMNKSMGFDKDQVMLIQGTGNLNSAQDTTRRLPVFKTELQKLEGVKSVSIADMLPVTGGKRNMMSYWRAGREKMDPRVAAQSWWVDPDYIATFGMKLVLGRSFSADIAGDSSAVVINEAMIAQLGLKGDPVGQELSYGGNFKMHVVGVVADFNYESVKDAVKPLALHLGNWATMVAVKTNTANMAGLIKKVSAVWKTFSPQRELRYAFLDESFARMYDDVRRTGNIFTALATLAVIIACLGLLALSAFMAEQRRKEVGIRKVLGATVMQLAGLMSGEFVKLVLIAIVVATPLAYWGMHVWLQNYIYRIDIGVWVFVAAGMVVVAIALATISWQAIRAAMANPVGSLRAE
jgi:putative ABC transport system permease protein